MQKKIKVYHAGKRGSGYSNWVPNREIVHSVEEADLVFVNGGSDIDTRIYGEEKRHSASWGFTRMEHDEELADIRTAIGLGKKLWGTCKGIQYGCAVSGGKLIQDISHPGRHTIKTEDGKVFSVNSMHHQMCYPFNLPEDEYRIIGAADNLSNHHDDGEGKQMNVPIEPEILFFSKTQFLGTQWHPEAMQVESEPVKYCQDLLKKLMEDKL